jgi:hypothetical protein
MGPSQTEEMTLPVLETVADAAGSPIAALPPLSESVNLDGLDALVTNDDDHDVTVTFRYAGHRIVVHSNGTVYAHPIRDGGGIDAPPLGEH